MFTHVINLVVSIAATCQCFSMKGCSCFSSKCSADRWTSSLGTQFLVPCESFSVPVACLWYLACFGLCRESLCGSCGQRLFCPKENRRVIAYIHFSSCLLLGSQMYWHRMKEEEKIASKASKVSSFVGLFKELLWFDDANIFLCLLEKVAAQRRTESTKKSLKVKAVSRCIKSTKFYVEDFKWIVLTKIKICWKFSYSQTIHVNEFISSLKNFEEI